jgi:hypothetical protein
MPKKVDFESNTLYVNSKNSKYAGHNMYMTDNEDTELVEDTISRRKEKEKDTQHWWRNTAKMLEDWSKPQSLIDHAIMRSKMTYPENEEFIIKYNKYKREEDREFLKNNPPKKEIVEKLYERFDKVKHNMSPGLISQLCFERDVLDPLDGILTGEEYSSIQYDAVLELLFLEYINIHKEAINRMYGEDDYKPYEWENDNSYA